MQEEYEINPEYRSYVDGFCSQYHKTVDEALQHVVVREVGEQYRQERMEQ